jgi:hypothetical protein
MMVTSADMHRSSAVYANKCGIGTICAENDVSLYSIAKLLIEDSALYKIESQRKKTNITWQPFLRIEKSINHSKATTLYTIRSHNDLCKQRSYISLTSFWPLQFEVKHIFRRNYAKKLELAKTFWLLWATIYFSRHFRSFNLNKYMCI